MTVHFPKAGLPVADIADYDFKLVARRRETSDIVTFTFDIFAAEGQPFRHLPGQSVAITFPMPEGDAVRTFTIASSGLRENQAELTIKAAPDAQATRWAHDHLAIGQTLKARGPLGKFSVIHAPNQPLLLIGAGSGITPVMSMLRWLHGRGEETDAVFIQVARAPEYLLFQDELTKIASEMPKLHRYDVVTRLADNCDWNGYRGRITGTVLETMAPNMSGRTAFCCGPDGFMADIKSLWERSGGLIEKFHTESFGVSINTVAVRPAQISQDPGTGFKGSIDGVAFELSSEDTLLEAVASAGKRIPSGCREGQCGACRVRLVAGEVEMSHQQGISRKEEQSGIILTCCSRARSDVVLQSV